MTYTRQLMKRNRLILPSGSLRQIQRETTKVNEKRTMSASGLTTRAICQPSMTTNYSGVR